MPGGGGGADGGGGGADGVPIDVCRITTPTTWAKGVHVARCNIEVASTLSIEPGAIVKFAPGFHLSVDATAKLTAVGTDSLPIVFTSTQDDARGGDAGGDGPTTAAPGDWGCAGPCGGLDLRGSGSVLTYVQVLYASSGAYVQADSIEITDSVFAHHQAYGMVLDGPLESAIVTRNSFFGNQGFPLRLARAVFLDSSNVFHDPLSPGTLNKKQCVELATDIDRVTALGVTEVAFLFSGHAITAGLLTPPGVVFKAENAQTRLAASGSLVNGPNAIFTSSKDDSLAGDCTGDGATAPAAGDWQGLWIEDGSTSGYSAPVDYVRFAAESGNMQPH